MKFTERQLIDIHELRGHAGWAPFMQKLHEMLRANELHAMATDADLAFKLASGTAHAYRDLIRWLTDEGGLEREIMDYRDERVRKDESARARSKIPGSRHSER